jgi:hypothetical protein
MEEAKRKKDTSQTKTGLLILTIGYSALAIIIGASVFDLLFGLLAPVAGLIGIVGGLLILLARDTFGRAHSRNAIVSALLFIVSLVTIVVGKILFGAALVLSRIPNGTITYGTTTSSTVNPYLILYITSTVATALTGLAIVFLTYALHRKDGRIILSISYIAFLTLTILMTVLILQGLATDFTMIAVDPSSLQTMRYQYEILQLLTVIPTLAFAFTFYLAWSRINRGELPESITLTTTPAY